MSDFHIVLGFIVFCVLVLMAALILVKDYERKAQLERQKRRDEQNRLASERLNGVRASRSRHLRIEGRTDDVRGPNG